MAKVYPVSVPMPDLSNVYSLSRSLGRNTGYNEFARGLLEHRRDIEQMRIEERLKRQTEEMKSIASGAKTKKTSAESEDEESDDGSEGFFEKLDNFYYDKIEPVTDKVSGFVFDAISRGTQASANAVGKLSEEKEEGFLNKFSDTDEAIKGFWQGLKGQGEYKSTAQVIAKRAKENKDDTLWDNRIAQGVAGFVGDVALDPTTYIGVGLISKPLKAGKQAVENSKVSGLADDLAKLDLKPDGHDVPLTSSQIYTALGGSPKTKAGAPRRTASRKANQAAHMQQATDNIAEIKDLLRRDPRMETDKAIQKLDSEIDRLSKVRQADMDDVQQQVYESKLKEFDSKPELHPGRPKITDTYNEVVKISSLKSAISQARMAGGKASRTARAEKGKPLGKTSKQIREETRLSTFFDKINPAVLKDPRFSPPVMQGLVKMADDVVRQDTKAVEVKDRIGAITARLNNLRNKQSVTPASQVDTKKKLDSQIKKEEAARVAAYGQLDHIEASILMRIMRNHGAQAPIPPENLGQIKDLTTHGMRVLQKLKLISPETQLADAAASVGNDMDLVVEAARRAETMKLDFKTGKVEMQDPDEFAAVEGGVFDDVRALREELTNTANEIKRLRGEDIDSLLTRATIERPVGVPADIKVDEAFLNREWDDPKHQEWADLVREEGKVRRDHIVEKKIKNWRRKKREERAKGAGEKVPKFIRSAYGPGRKYKKNSAFGEKPTDLYKYPKVRHPGTHPDRPDLYQDDKDDLLKFTTEDDVREALRRSKKADAQDLVDLGNVKWSNITKKDHVNSEQLRQQIEQFTKSKGVTVHPAHVTFERLFKEQHGKSISDLNRERQAHVNMSKTEVSRLEDYNPQVPADVRRQFEEEANQQVFKEMTEEVNKDSFRAFHEKDIPLKRDSEQLEEIHRSMIAEAREEYAQSALRAKMELNGKELESELNALRQERDLKKSLAEEAFVEARKARAAAEKRIDEQLLLNILEENVKTGNNYLRLGFAGAKIADIPTFGIMTKATEKLGGLPILATAQKAWADGFKPASAIEPELNLARLRAMSRTPNIIKHHVDDIRHRFARYKPGDRKAAMKGIMKGAPVGDQALQKSMDEYFRELTPYLTGQVDIAGKPLELAEINRFLPEEYRFVGDNSKRTDQLRLDTPQAMLQAMRRLPQNADPMKVMWNVRIATEQALAQKNLQNTITRTYGVRREVLADSDLAGSRIERKKIVEQLHDKHGWTTVNDLGEDFYFAPEIAEDVKKLLSMMKPQNAHWIVRGYDKATRAWKSAVTVYNPGYYTRNAIGEYIMSAFDGLTDPRWYTKAAAVMRHSMPDEMESVIKDMNPAGQWSKLRESPGVRAGKKVVTLKGGKELTAEDVWVLYNDQGLKSGFISSEFDHYFPAAGSLKSSLPGRAGSAINDKVRSGGEKFEDYWRLAHFMYRMQKSPHRHATEAAREAAEYVRKYHFDYTDFTPFEKSTMMRLFPFYKWTRKAFPLMASMLFTQPGKVAIYPKMMQNISYATGGTDPLTDDTGFMPDYEEVTPEWIRGMLAYPIGQDEEDAMTYANMATPQFDIFKMSQSPVSAGIGMLNPFLKVPLEQAQGNTLDPKFDIEIEGSQERTEHLARTTPLGSLLMNIMKNEQPGEDSSITEPNVPLDEKLTSFLTGLGFYENNEKRQQGEQLRINLGGER